jgi:hypothetical protein
LLRRLPHHAQQRPFEGGATWGDESARLIKLRGSRSAVAHTSPEHQPVNRVEDYRALFSWDQAPASTSCPAHPNLLIRPTVAANAAVEIRGVGAVLQVVSEGCRQGGLQLLAPFLIGPGEPKHPVRGQAEVAQYRPEWLTRIDRVEEPLPHLDGEPLLRSGQPPGLLGVAVCLSAKGAVASGVPTC